ncbi:hypothetical protein TNCV_849801, partial [Trichonephila clavipes]
SEDNKKIREEQKKNREQLENLERMMADYKKQRKKSTKVQNNAAEQPSSSSNEVEQMSCSKLLRSDGSNNKTRKEMKDQEMSSYMRHGETAHNGTNDQWASTSQQQFYDQGANNQQQESDVQLSCAQLSQQKEPSARVISGQASQQQVQATNMPPMSRSRSSSLSSSGGSNNDQPGPSSSLSEVPLISRSQSLNSSLNSLHSDDSGTEIDGSSQCR